MNNGAERPGLIRISLAELCRVLRAEVICGQHRLDEEVTTACGCDLMSDVLAFTRPGSVLLTGLTNQQVVRTAEMLDLKAVIIVRNKRPDEATVALAEAGGLPILLTPYPLYESCGLLYAMGLMGCMSPQPAETDDIAAIKDAEPPGQEPCQVPLREG